MAGRGCAGRTGAGAGWADARDENVSDVAMTMRNLDNGIKFTGCKSGIVGEQSHRVAQVRAR